MTLDVRIGKITRMEKPHDENVGIRDLHTVDECPDADFDVCDPENKMA